MSTEFWRQYWQGKRGPALMASSTFGAVDLRMRERQTEDVPIDIMSVDLPTTSASIQDSHVGTSSATGTCMDSGQIPVQSSLQACLVPSTSPTAFLTSVKDEPLDDTFELFATQHENQQEESFYTHVGSLSSAAIAAGAPQGGNPFLAQLGLISSVSPSSYVNALAAGNEATVPLYQSACSYGNAYPTSWLTDNAVSPQSCIAAEGDIDCNSCGGYNQSGYQYYSVGSSEYLRTPSCNLSFRMTPTPADSMDPAFQSAQIPPYSPQFGPGTSLTTTVMQEPDSASKSKRGRKKKLPQPSLDTTPATTVMQEPHGGSKKKRGRKRELPQPSLDATTATTVKQEPYGGSKKKRGRKKAPQPPQPVIGRHTRILNNPPPPGMLLPRVYVWDLDETIIIHHSLLTGSFASLYSKHRELCLSVGLDMEEMIFDFAEQHFFYRDLEDYNQVHVNAVRSDDNGQDLSNYNFAADGYNIADQCVGSAPWKLKTAFRYRRMKDIYNQYRTSTKCLLTPEKRQKWSQLRENIEALSDNWRLIAHTTLTTINSRPRCVNVLVATTHLSLILAKVLMFSLGDIFAVENIYSASRIGRKACFERIIERFGTEIYYFAVGDGTEEQDAANEVHFPFWKVSGIPDLIKLQRVLETECYG